MHIYAVPVRDSDRPSFIERGAFDKHACVSPRHAFPLIGNIFFVRGDRAPVPVAVSLGKTPCRLWLVLLSFSAWQSRPARRGYLDGSGLPIASLDVLESCVYLLDTTRRAMKILLALGGSASHASLSPRSVLHGVSRSTRRS